MATRTITYLQAKKEALAEEMRRDPTVIIMGTDVETNPYKATDDLAAEFGSQRVRNTPLSEGGFTGAAIGAAVNGLRPVVDVFTSSFLMVAAWDQIVNQAANLRYMFGGQTKVPVTIRCTTGAGRAAAAQHSHSLYSMLMNRPGVKLVLPASPHDMKGLLKTAIRDDNPVVVFEALALGGMRGPVPEEEYLVPFGVADVKRPGKDITIVALSAMVAKALSAAQQLAEAGIDAEVVDPRTIVPLDKEAILKSVAKTGHLVVVDEATRSCSVASEIAAIVAEEGFGYLKAPIRRVTAPDVPMPFSPPLEQFVIPNEQQIVDAARSVLSGSVPASV